MPVLFFYSISIILFVSLLVFSITRLPFGIGWYVGQVMLAGAAVLVGKGLMVLGSWILHSPLHFYD